jgi:hypothetical protein
MANIDAKVARVVDARGADSDDEDALFAALEEDDDHALSALRERRMQQLHEEVQRSKVMREAGTGSYLEVKEEKEVMDVTTGTKFAVVHFFKPDFGRCGVMDGHLDVCFPSLMFAYYGQIADDSM